MTIDTPTSMTAPETAYTVFYALFGVNVVLTLIWLVWELRRSGRNEALLAVVGGTIVGYFVPPVYNFLTKVWFPSNIPWPYIEAFGMKDPVFDLIGYASFIGVGGYLFLLQLRAGSRHAVLKTFLFWGLTDLILELPFLASGMYTYYGDQPFLVGGFPLHWVVINGTIPLVSGAFMYLALDRWEPSALSPGLRITTAPILAAGAMMIPIFPIAVTLHGEFPTVAVWMAAVAGMAVCGWMLWAIQTFCVNDRSRAASPAPPAI